MTMVMNRYVESRRLYYARNIKSAVKGIDCCGIKGHFNIIKQLI